MSELYEQLLPYIEKSKAYNTALTLFSWDNETLAPKAALNNTSKLIGILANDSYTSIINPQVKELLNQLTEEKEHSKLTFNEQKNIKLLKKQYDELEAIPQTEYAAYSELSAKAGAIWAKAKQENDYASFAPVLEEIISYQRKFASYRNKQNKQLYDVLLDDYEEGMDTKQLDLFFEKLRDAIVPLVKELKKHQKPVDDAFNFRHYDIEKQRKLNHKIAIYEGFDFDRGVLKESEHPFTTSLHNKDVRITTHYYENNLVSSLFSVIHETGHALYEMGISDELTFSPAGNAASMSMHESQSRFYENMIGRSKEFWEPLFPQLVAMFPENLSDVTLDQFILAINKPETSLIRTEADELTYSLHIMIRYELEKQLISGELSVEELPAAWNKKYEEYLGITPDSDTNGVLQDVHWSGGMFGYFPSYAMGSAIAAQIYHYMNKEFSIADCLKKKDLKPVQEYLRKNIHQYGATLTVNEILLKMCNEPFNPQYYINYLTDKFTRLFL